MMTEKEAWVMIRDAFHRYAETGKNSGLTIDGICTAISMLHNKQNLITTDICESMKSKMIRPETDWHGAFWWPIDEVGARERVKFIDEILKTL
jgi:hypothetical protein